MMTPSRESRQAFAWTLRHYRESAALTQDELAQRSGLTSRAISDMERGRTARPYLRSVRLLADALELPPPARESLIAAARATSRAGKTDPPGTGSHPVITDWSARPVPQQLPSALPSFVGRALELKALSTIVSESGSSAAPPRIAVVTGTAGVGKTTLVVRWAHQATAHFPDGQLYVNLRGFDPSGQSVEPADAIRTFLEGLQVPASQIPAGPRGQQGLYRSLLAGKRMLIVLDNARDADQVRPLLPGGRGCRTVITSREQMAGLAAVEGALHVCLDVLTHSDARNLLTLRLGGERVAREPAAAAQLLELCAQLPLALGIAAARAAGHPEFSLADVAAGLQEVESTLDVLSGGDPATDLRAVFSWSYQQLSADASRMFRLTGTHPGPDVTVPAAASLAGVAMPHARRLLGDLARAHLLTEHMPGRYSCHDLLRAYAVEQAGLADSEVERSAAVERLLSHCLHTAHAADQLMHPYRRQVALTPQCSGVTVHDPATAAQALMWFDAEHSSLLAAVALAVRSKLDTYAWQLPWAMETFMYRRGHWHDWAATQEIALAAAQRLGDYDALTEANSGVGSAQLELGRADDAVQHLSRALALAEQASDLAGQARMHLEIARAREKQGHFNEALLSTDRGLRLCQAADSAAGPVLEANALNQMGWELNNLGRYQEALGCCQRAVALIQQLGNKHAESSALDSLGYSLGHLGRHTEAADCYVRAVELHEELGERYQLAETLTYAGDAYQAAGDIPAARRAWTRALTILEELHHPDTSQVLARLDCLTSASRHGFAGPDI